MARKLGCVTLVLALAVPALAAGKPGTIAGYVRNSAGTPQMGAMVEVFTRAIQPMTVFTDAHGHFAASGLTPGVYHVKVTAPSFLPALRENVPLRAGSAVLVDFTLNTLFEAMQLLPTPRATSDEDGWKWTLRSAANRPILRVMDNGPMVVTKGNERTLKARVAFVAGSQAEGFGSAGEMSTNFSLERSIFSSGTLSLGGNVGYGAGPQDGVVRASYSHRMGDGSTPELTLTMRRFATPDSVVHGAALQAFTLRMSDSFSLANFIDLHAGSEYQTVQFMGRASAIKPFGSVDVHLSPNSVVEYQYATAEPNTRRFMGFDSAPADLSESGPRMTMVDSAAVLERARHQEISYSRRFKGTNVQVAGYTDHIRNTALTGAGDVDTTSGQLLPDIYSGTFTYNGGDLDARGLRVVVQQKLPSHMAATLSYSYGNVLDLLGSDLNWQSVRGSIHQEWRHSLGGKLTGTMPLTHTKWIASYRFTNGNALTPVDMFDNSPGQMDPFWNVFIRQPIPGTGFLPGKMEALVDLRNLMAQGYVPVIGPDGHTLYLVQSARAVRGGVAFVF